jgi:ubiquinone biosynthesis protein COQ9
MAVWQAVGMLKSGRADDARKAFKRIERLIETRLGLDHDFHGHYHYLKAVLLCATGNEAGYRRQLEKARNNGWSGSDWGFRF